MGRGNCLGHCAKQRRHSPVAGIHIPVSRFHIYMSEGMCSPSNTSRYVHIVKSPDIYSIGVDYQDEDVLIQKCADIIHSAAAILKKCHLIQV